jgi:hypothetical protein
MVEITTTSSAIFINGIKYSIKAMSNFVVLRLFPSKEIYIEYLPSNKLVLSPTRCDKILLDDVSYPFTEAGFTSCFLDLQAKIS